ncbi:MAG: NAD(P)/FAD-dependent oxidoreductase, partial [Pirellulales bacterium]
DKLRRLLNEIPDLSSMLLEAFQLRRKLLEDAGVQGMKVVGAARSPETALLREFFHRNHVVHKFFDAGEAEGQEQLRLLNATAEEMPVVACHEKVLKRPSVVKIAECLGISRQIDDTLYDLVIVGAGPAGLSAGVYAASEGLSTLIVDRVGPGGQAGSSSRIENFIGFPSGISGADLANRGYLQALKFGAHFTAPTTIRSLESSDDGVKQLALCTGQIARARSVLIASGVSCRQLEIEGCRRLQGAGVYYAATSVEGRVCTGGTAVVVGGGNSAGQAAMFLAQCARHVKLVIRGDDLAKSMSQYLCRRIEQHDRIEVIYNSEVSDIEGDAAVESVRLSNRKTGEDRTIPCAAVFIFIGAKPHTEWLPGTIRLDDKGFVVTGATLQDDPLWRDKNRTPCELETTCEGVMAAGDVRAGTTKRCGFAVGDGSLAVTCVHRHLNRL